MLGVLALFLLVLVAHARAGDRTPYLAYVDVSNGSEDVDETLARSVREQVLGAMLECGTTSFAECERARRPSEEWTEHRVLYDLPRDVDASLVRLAMGGSASARQAMTEAFTAEDAPGYVDGLVVVDIHGQRVTITVLLPDGRRIARTNATLDHGTIPARVLTRVERTLMRAIMARFSP